MAENQALVFHRLFSPPFIGRLPSTIHLLPPPPRLFLRRLFVFYLLQLAVSFSFTYPDLRAHSIAVSSLFHFPPSHSHTRPSLLGFLPRPRRCFSEFGRVSLANSPTVLLISLFLLRGKKPKKHARVLVFPVSLSDKVSP